MSQNNQNINNLLNTLSKQLGTNPENLQNSAKNGNVQNLLNKMDPKQAQHLQKVLSDEEATKKMLSTPQAQALLKKLMGDK